jgi:hypothetical protein
MRTSVIKENTQKKPEDNSKQLENIRKLGSNKQCFDCGEKGTTYVALSFGTFVCTRCSGLLRDLNFKVKGIGVSIFSDNDLALLTKMGNDNAKNIWLAKFDTKKEKIPDPKDSEAIRKHITLKYKEKRFAVKDPEKQMTASEIVKPKRKVSEESEEESGDDDSDSESESPSPKKKSTKNKNAKVTEEKKLTPVQQTKLTPINLKNSTNTVNKNAPTNDGWANFPSSKPNLTNNFDNSGFTFFDTNTQTNTKNGSSGKRNTFENEFTFTNEVTTNVQNLNNNSNVNVNDWGIVWDNKSPNKIISNPQQNSTSHFNFMTETNTNKAFDNQIDFNFVNSGQTINNNYSSQPITTNINQINQSLNTINNEQKVQSKKKLDDLDSILNDTSLITPVNQTGNLQQNSNFQGQFNPLNNMQMNMKGQQMTQLPQMQQMQQMPLQNPQNMNNNLLMQQMQNMLMNPQMQSNPQMINMMQMMMQNMMMGNNNIHNQGINVGHNMPPLNSMNNNSNLNEINFGMSNLNINPNMNTLNFNNQPKEEEAPQVDLFKDIYNYSKSTVGKPQSTSNININYQTATNETKAPNNSQVNSSYNPFDFY